MQVPGRSPWLCSGPHWIFLVVALVNPNPVEEGGPEDQLNTWNSDRPCP